MQDMKKSKWVFVLLAGGFFMVFVSCKQPLPPEYEGFENAQISKISGQESIVSTNLKLYNPNHFGLQLKRAEMDVLLNDKAAGHSVLDSTINIPARDTFYVPVTLQVNMQSIFSNALQVLLTRQVKVTLNGTARLNRSGISFNVPFHYEGAQDLTALLQPGN